MFGFLGPNGAGKSTTIKMLCTLLRPTAGRASVAGYDVTQAPGAVRAAIGVVFQDSTLDQYLTAEQNLRLHCQVYHVPRGERATRIAAGLALVGLTERRGDQVRTFSGGMKRRLEIARGLLHAPRVLFLDEPTQGLDPQTRRSIWEHVLRLRATHGTTIFMTTHYMAEAEHCDRIAIMDRGRVVALDSPARLKQRVGGDRIRLATDDDDAAAARLAGHFGLAPERENGAVTVRVPNASDLVPRLIRELPVAVRSVTVHEPTLEDVFVQVTGRAIREEEAGSRERLEARLRERGRLGGQ